MLIAAFWVLGATALVGSVLALLHLRTVKAPNAPWPLKALHGLLGVAGLCMLALALRGPPQGVEQGTGSFGIIAASLLALAALIGVGMLTVNILKQRIPELMIGVHATIAVTGIVILMAYVFSG